MRAVLGGESFSALAESLQEALGQLKTGTASWQSAMLPSANTTACTIMLVGATKWFG